MSIPQHGGASPAVKSDKELSDEIRMLGSKTSAEIEKIVVQLKAASPYFRQNIEKHYQGMKVNDWCGKLDSIKTNSTYDHVWLKTINQPSNSDDLLLHCTGAPQAAETLKYAHKDDPVLVNGIIERVGLYDISLKDCTFVAGKDFILKNQSPKSQPSNSSLNIVISGNIIKDCETAINFGSVAKTENTFGNKIDQTQQRFGDGANQIIKSKGTDLSLNDSERDQNSNRNWWDKPIGKIVIPVASGLILTLLIWIFSSVWHKYINTPAPKQDQGDVVSPDIICEKASLDRISGSNIDKYLISMVVRNPSSIFIKKIHVQLHRIMRVNNSYEAGAPAEQSFSLELSNASPLFVLRTDINTALDNRNVLFLVVNLKCETGEHPAREIIKTYFFKSPVYEDKRTELLEYVSLSEKADILLKYPQMAWKRD